MKKSRKILLVEDDRITATLGEKLLIKNGFDVLTANSGEMAIGIVNEAPSIDLILMDIDLDSEMDGTEAARIILENNNIPIVFLTSHSEKSMVDRVKKITSYGYILKDSGEFVLISSINMAFELFEALNLALKQEENFRTLYESISGGVLVVNNEYIIEDVNDITCELTGFSKEELVGQLCDKLCPKGSESRKCPIWEEGSEGFTGMDTSIKCSDDSKTPILKNARRMVINGQRMIFENFQDISQQKSSELEFQKLIEEKDQKIRELEEVIKHNNLKF